MWGQKPWHRTVGPVECSLTCSWDEVASKLSLVHMAAAKSWAQEFGPVGTMLAQEVLQLDCGSQVSFGGKVVVVGLGLEQSKLAFWQVHVTRRWKPKAPQAQQGADLHWRLGAQLESAGDETALGCKESLGASAEGERSSNNWRYADKPKEKWATPARRDVSCRNQATYWPIHSNDSMRPKQQAFSRQENWHAQTMFLFFFGRICNIGN